MATKRKSMTPREKLDIMKAFEKLPQQTTQQEATNKLDVKRSTLGKLLKQKKSWRKAAAATESALDQVIFQRLTLVWLNGFMM